MYSDGKSKQRSKHQVSKERCEENSAFHIYDYYRCFLILIEEKPAADQTSVGAVGKSIKPEIKMVYMAKKSNIYMAKKTNMYLPGRR